MLDGEIGGQRSCPAPLGDAHQLDSLIVIPYAVGIGPSHIPRTNDAQTHSVHLSSPPHFLIEANTRLVELDSILVWNEESKRICEIDRRVPAITVE